jgi:hypothetical protein
MAKTNLQKLLTASVVEAIVLLLISIFVVNGFIAPLAPAWIAAIPLALSMQMAIGLIIAVVIKNYAQKTFLQSYM